MSRAALLLLACQCAGAALVELHGSGTTNPKKLIWRVIDKFTSESKTPLRITYRAVGSGTGQSEFMGEANPAGAFTPYSDFGAGDMPIPTADYDKYAADGGGIGVLHVPFVLGAMSFFHHVPGTAGFQADGCLLAKIFKREVTVWDDPLVVEQNPDLVVPARQPIVVHHRTFSSSTTKGITTYLHAACPATWGSELVGSTISWPTDTVAVQGSGQMSSSIASTEYVKKALLLLLVLLLGCATAAPATTALLPTRYHCSYTTTTTTTTH